MFHKKFKKASIYIAAGMMIIGSSLEGFCQPHRPRGRTVVHRPVPYHGRVVVRHPVPRYGRPVVKLPPKHRKVVVGRHSYFFHQGIFYRSGPGAYVVTRAPVGAIVATIPMGFFTFVVADLTYFYYGGVYYRKVHTGYRVVEPPPETVVVHEYSNDSDTSPAMGDHVSVTAESLNVRSGPNKTQSVITIIPRGTVMTIRGHAPGWLYVELDDGTCGWIMQGYTALLSQSSSG